MKIHDNSSIVSNTKKSLSISNQNRLFHDALYYCLYLLPSHTLLRAYFHNYKQGRALGVRREPGSN